MAKRVVSDPFDELLDLRDDLFVSELKKVAAVACREFGLNGVLDAVVYASTNDLYFAMACSSIATRYEEMKTLIADIERGLAKGVSPETVSRVQYECVSKRVADRLLNLELSKLRAAVLKRMGELLLNVYRDFPDYYDIAIPDPHASALDPQGFNALVKGLSQKVADGIKRTMELSENGKKGAAAKQNGDELKKLSKKVNVVSRKIDRVDNRVKGYRDAVREDEGKGITVKTPANEKLIKEIFDEYWKLLKLPKYDGKKARTALTDAMRNVVERRNGDMADFKDERSLRSELGREKRYWEARYAEQMTDGAVSEPDFGLK